MLLPASHLLLNSRKNLSSGNCLVSTLCSSMMSIIVRVCCFLQDFAFHLAAAWRETQTELLIPWLGIFFSFRWANMCFGFEVFTRHQLQQQTPSIWIHSGLGWHSHQSQPGDPVNCSVSLATQHLLCKGTPFSPVYTWQQETLKMAWSSFPDNEPAQEKENPCSPDACVPSTKLFQGIDS